MSSIGFHRRAAVLFLCVAFVLGSTLASYAEPITGLSGIPAFQQLKKFYHVPNFKLGGDYEFGNEAAFEFGGSGGVTLESLGQEPLRLAYIAVGTPRRDKGGNIVNAVIISSYYSGDSTFMYNYWYEGCPGNTFSKGAVVGPGKLIDTDSYYVIFLDALGLWGCSKPSDGLGPKFPKYTILDMVQANYRLLKDELGINRVRLATGVSMGAIQSYVLAAMHPDFVEGIMPVGGITQSDPVVKWLFQLMTAAMESDPVWRSTKGDYYSLPKDQHPNNGVMFGFSILGQTINSFDYRLKQPWDEVKKEVFYWEPKGDEGAILKSRAKIFDMNDLLSLNRCLEGYDLSGELNRIRARTLILHVKNDQWLLYATAEQAAKQIAGAKLAGFDDPMAHQGIFRAPNVLNDRVKEFFREIGMN
jgi:homoserine acetyltransferase